MKAGWRSTTIGDILRLEYGKPLPDAERVDDGRYPVYGANGVKGRTNRCYYDRLSIIVGRKGSAGELNLTEGGFWPLDVTYFVKLRGETDLKFVWFLLTRLNLPSLAKGIKPGINRNEVYSIPVSIPSKKEQERIVAILDKAFEAIATAKANAEKNLQNAEFLFSDYLGIKFSKVWQSSRLVKLSDLATDITDGDHLPPPKSAKGVPFVTISNINKQTRRIDYTDTFFVSHQYFESLKPNKKPRKGDLLFTVTGSFGIPVKVEDNFEFCFQRHIGLIRPKPDVSTSWLYYLMLSPQLFQQADERATGTAQRTVSLAVLRDLSVPKLRLSEQQSMASKLDELKMESECLKAVYQRKLAALDALKQSLLHQAFTGKL